MKLRTLRFSRTKCLTWGSEIAYSWRGDISAASHLSKCKSKLMESQQTLIWTLSQRCMETPLRLNFCITSNQSAWLSQPTIQEIFWEVQAWCRHRTIRISCWCRPCSKLSSLRRKRLKRLEQGALIRRTYFIWVLGPLSEQKVSVARVSVHSSMFRQLQNRSQICIKSI